MRIRVTLVAEPDGDRFHAYCAELTGIHSDRDTEEDAFQRINRRSRHTLQQWNTTKHRYLPASWTHLQEVNLPEDPAILRFEPTE